MRFLSFLSVLVATAFVSHTALADAVFMVQLGSYETQEAADSAWKNLKSDHDSLLGELQSRSSRITLSAGNEIQQKYRLQAGPIKSRVSAKNICDDLDGSAPECFVVETAMFTNDGTTPAVLDNVTSPVQVAATESANFGTDVFGSIKEAILSPFSAEASSEKLPESLEAVETPATPVSTENTLETEEPTQAQPQENTNEAPAQSVAELREAVEEEDANTGWFGWLRGNKPRRLFTNRNTPTDRTAVSNAETVPTEVVPQPQPVEEVKSAPPATSTPMRSEVIVQPLPGVNTASIANAFTQENATPTSISGATEGSVEVMEAIPVDISDDAGEDSDAKLNVPPAATQTGLPVLSEERIFGIRQPMLSQNRLAQKPSWVKISYFADDKAAMDHWRKLKASHADILQGLRMRITRPYAARSTGSQRTSLQLGPVASKEAVDRLCQIAATPDTTCQIQQETTAGGTGFVPSETRYQRRESSSAHPDMERRMNAPSQYIEQYWAQLGTYTSRADAYKVWDELKNRHTEELQGKFPHLAFPTNSDSSRTIYRLRTGPFATQAAATALCEKLSSASTPCSVAR